MVFKNNKKLFWSLFALALIAGIFWSLTLLAPKSLNQGTIKINDSLLSVEIAASPREQYQGLSGRQTLEANSGMLFVYPNRQEQAFVMRNMLFPLDILFIDQGEIKKIAANLEPEGAEPKIIYRSEGLVDQVLELNGGYCAKNNIKIGDQVLFKQ